jgi:hypothetical protein
VVGVEVADGNSLDTMEIDAVAEEGTGAAVTGIEEEDGAIGEGGGEGA